MCDKESFEGDGCRCRKVTMPECWFLVVVWDPCFNVLSAERSPCMNVCYLVWF